MTTFQHFLPMGGKYIATFSNEPDEDGEIRLNQDNLAERIGNLVDQGLDASVEMTALAGLKQINDLIGSAPALRASHDRLRDLLKDFCHAMSQPSPDYYAMSKTVVEARTAIKEATR